MKLMVKIALLSLLVFYTSGCGIINKSQDPTGTADSQTSQTQQNPQASQDPQTSQASQTSQDQTQTSSEAGSPTALTPTPTSSPICRWIAVDQDVVSPNEIKTDGKPDGHFHVAVPFNQPSALKSIIIRYSQFGKSFKWSWVYNQNLPIQGYVMGVLDGSGQVILPQGDNGYRVEGLMDFELYLSELENENGRDTFKFADKETFDLQINYVTDKNEVKELKYTVRIEGTDGSSEEEKTVIQ